jgi:hypothetical protein
MEFGFDAATARPVEVPVGVAYNCRGFVIHWAGQESARLGHR